ncbi:MAG: ATP-dependent Clp protease adapter ClpS [Verrucomicrobiota bacterium]|jgi:ATP-dependent Clp protease adaptor protein ClpS
MSTTIRERRWGVRGEGGAPGVATPDWEVAEEVGRETPWNVVVHNDPVNLMSYVTRVFQKVFGFSRERAEKHMLEVHQKGKSVVWSGPKERAELYVQQLQGFLLLCTMERGSV